MLDNETLRTRFFALIRQDPGSDCILWCGTLREKGYGRFWDGDRLRPATHVSWFLKHGIWPALKMLHDCDNPSCVNPDHLWEGTDADNIADCIAKGRRHQQATLLSYLERKELLALSDTAISRREAAALFGVSLNHLVDLRRERVIKEGSRPPKPAPPALRPAYDVGGRQLTAPEIAAETGLHLVTIRWRLRQGITGEALLAGKHKGVRKPYVRRR